MRRVAVLLGGLISAWVVSGPVSVRAMAFDAQARISVGADGCPFQSSGGQCLHLGDALGDGNLVCVNSSPFFFCNIWNFKWPVGSGFIMAPGRVYADSATDGKISIVKEFDDPGALPPPAPPADLLAPLIRFEAQWWTYKIKGLVRWSDGLVDVQPSQDYAVAFEQDPFRLNLVQSQEGGPELGAFHFIPSSGGSPPNYFVPSIDRSTLQIGQFVPNQGVLPRLSIRQPAPSPNLDQAQEAVEHAIQLEDQALHFQRLIDLTPSPTSLARWVKRVRKPLSAAQAAIGVATRSLENAASNGELFPTPGNPFPLNLKRELRDATAQDDIVSLEQSLGHERQHLQRAIKDKITALAQISADKKLLETLSTR